MTASQPANALRLMDLFAGCGGMTRGFVDAGGFLPVYAVEFDPDAAETYRRNFGDHVIEAPIEEVDEFPEVDVVVGGPPCQGFSLLNRDGVGLERRALWRHYLRALDESGAGAFVMENVPQLLTSVEYESFRAAAEERGFHVEGRVLLAADYGVPQLRRRAIVLGVRGETPVWPAASHSDPKRSAEAGLPSWRTFRDAMSEGRRLPSEPDGRAWHRARNPRPMSLERYRTIPGEGEGRFELAARRPDITPRCWLNKPTGTTDVFGRLWWDRPVIHHPHRVLQAGEGALSASVGAPPDHRARGGAADELPRRLRPTGESVDDEHRATGGQCRPSHARASPRSIAAGPTNRAVHRRPSRAPGRLKPGSQAVTRSSRRRQRRSCRGRDPIQVRLRDAHELVPLERSVA